MKVLLTGCLPRHLTTRRVSLAIYWGHWVLCLFVQVDGWEITEKPTKTEEDEINVPLTLSVFRDKDEVHFNQVAVLKDDALNVMIGIVLGVFVY